MVWWCCRHCRCGKSKACHTIRRRVCSQKLPNASWMKMCGKCHCFLNLRILMNPLPFFANQSFAILPRGAKSGMLVPNRECSIVRFSINQIFAVGRNCWQTDGYGLIAGGCLYDCVGMIADNAVFKIDAHQIVMDVGDIVGVVLQMLNSRKFFCRPLKNTEKFPPAACRKATDSK